MQHHAKVTSFIFVGAVGTAAATVLAFSAVQFSAQRAEATPAIAQGKPCNACHTSPTPSKGDVKR